MIKKLSETPNGSVVVKGQWIQYAFNAEVDTETTEGWVDVPFLVVAPEGYDGGFITSLGDNIKYKFASDGDNIMLARYTGSGMFIESTGDVRK